MKSLLHLAFFFTFFETFVKAVNLRVQRGLKPSVSDPLNDKKGAWNEDWHEPESRIVGGTDAAQGEFPFIVAWYWGSFYSPPGCGKYLLNLVVVVVICQ